MLYVMRTRCQGDSSASAERSEGCHAVSAADSLCRMPAYSCCSSPPSVGSHGCSHACSGITSCRGSHPSTAADSCVPAIQRKISKHVFDSASQSLHLQKISCQVQHLTSHIRVVTFIVYMLREARLALGNTSVSRMWRDNVGGSRVSHASSSDNSGSGCRACDEPLSDNIQEPLVAVHTGGAYIQESECRQPECFSSRQIKQQPTAARACFGARGRCCNVTVSSSPVSKGAS